MEQENEYPEETSDEVQAMEPVQETQPVQKQERQLPSNEMEYNFEMQRLALKEQRTLAIINDPDSRVRTSNYLKLQAMNFVRAVSDPTSGIRGLRIKITDNR